MTELAQHLSNAFGDRPGIGPLTFAAAFLVMALAMPRGISGAWSTLVASRPTRGKPGDGAGPSGKGRPARPAGTPQEENRNAVPLAGITVQDAEDGNPPAAT
jgi:hypothetical protein